MVRKKEETNKKITGIFTRYLFIILMGTLLPLFYTILTPLTVNTLDLALSVQYEPLVFENMIRLPTLIVEIIPACVAGAAFYLLLLLIFATPQISPSTRIRALITAFLALFVLNILRILILISLSGSAYFNTVHWVFWNLISTIFVVAIWIAITRIYKITHIPIYSDMKYLVGLTKKKH